MECRVINTWSPKTLSRRLKLATQVDFTEMYQRFPSAHLIELVSVAGVGQYQVTLADGNVLYFNANTNENWSTGEALATQLALSSYNGPGHVRAVEESWEAMK